MSRENVFTKEQLKEILTRIFSLCDAWELGELYQEETEAGDDIVEVAVNEYLDALYPVISEYFKFVPYLKGHDSTHDFFEHEFMYGDAIELSSFNDDAIYDGPTTIYHNEVYYLVSTGDIVLVDSFYVKSGDIEFEYQRDRKLLFEAEDYDAEDVCIDPAQVIEVFNKIISGEEAA